MLVPGGNAAIVNPVLHGANIAHPLTAHAAPLIRTAPVLSHAGPLIRTAPVLSNAVHAAPVIPHAPVGHAASVIAHPVAHAAPAYPEEPAPYTFKYGVADDYSRANFNAAETADGAGNVEGSYSVALPDGRTQHVNYHANGYDGYVAEVTYDGV